MPVVNASSKISAALIFLVVGLLLPNVMPSAHAFVTATAAAGLTGRTFAVSATNIDTVQATDCAVVGVGVLGTSLCQQILAKHKDWTVTGVTQTTRNHDAIKQAVADKERLTLTTRTHLAAQPDTKFSNVVFCAPPSGSEDYPADVRDAVGNLWNGEGVFCFTSSGGVYPDESGTVTETTPITETTPRTERLLKAEEIVTKAGGCVLRLAGLYILTRGAHGFYFKAEKPIPGNPDGLVNQLHYDDAAGACLAALEAGPAVCQGQIFLISDGQPLTRRQICQAALQTAAYRGQSMPIFAADSDNSSDFSDKPGKRYDGSHSNQVLNWSPRYKSFDAFMQDNA